MRVQEHTFVIPDFRFATAEVLPELRLHYRALGSPKRDGAGRVCNAVLILHGTGGSGEAFLREQFAGRLFGPGQLLDCQNYFIVLPDAIGHGQSSKPSDGLRARFPKYTYDDMVRAQHQLVSEALQVNHLCLVMGTSMGGMHTWLWGQQHPSFMDALMPLASLPVEIAGRNRMMRRMILDSIRNDPEWNGGDYDAQPRGLISAVHALIFMGSCPLQMQKEAPTRKASERLFDTLVQDYAAHFDANDMIYQFDASRRYDPAPDLHKIKAPLTAINSADDQVNPPELGILDEKIQCVKDGRYVLIPTSNQTRGHSSHSLPALWEPHLAALLERSAK